MFISDIRRQIEEDPRWSSRLLFSCQHGLLATATTAATVFYSALPFFASPYFFLFYPFVLIFFEASIMSWNMAALGLNKEKYYNRIGAGGKVPEGSCYAGRIGTSGDPLLKG